jgi:hypothetical protein
LHHAWNSRAKKPKYAPFKEGLLAAVEKLEDYYEKTAESDAHIFAMGKLFFFRSDWVTDYCPVLHPKIKMSHFRKYWTSVDEDEIISVLKEKVTSMILCSQARS